MAKKYFVVKTLHNKGLVGNPVYSSVWFPNGRVFVQKRISKKYPQHLNINFCRPGYSKMSLISIRIDNSIRFVGIARN